MPNSPNIASSSTGVEVYNNLANGNVGISWGDFGYGFNTLRIKTTGTASPGGLGGYYHLHQVAASTGYIHHIVANVPKGYSLNIGRNAIGDGAIVKWLTSNEGTGAFKNYAYVVQTGATGTFETIGFVYLSGGSAPVQWDVKSSVMYSTSRTASPVFTLITGLDSTSGITGWAITNSSAQPTTWYSKDFVKDLTVIDYISANGNYYIWLKDGAGNITSIPYTVVNVG